VNDRERIESLANEGRITREEANRLLELIDDIDSTEQSVHEAEEQAWFAQPAQAPVPPQAEPVQPAAPQNSAPPAGPGPEAHQGSNAGQQEPANPNLAGPGPDAPRQAPEAGATPPRWFNLEMLAGEVEVIVNPAVTRPTARNDEGQLELEETQDGVRLRNSGRDENFFDRLLGGFHRSTVEIELPEGWGLDVNLKAGELKVRGALPALRGSMLAGQLKAKEAKAVDLDVKAGEVDIGLVLTQGQHRIRTVTGSIDVRLLPGSDVEVTARVKIGDLDTPRDWQRYARGIGADAKHRIGAGTAKLELDVTTGDLDVTA